MKEKSAVMIQHSQKNWWPSSPKLTILLTEPLSLSLSHVQPDLSSVSPGIQVQQHCSEHSTGFQWTGSDSIENCLSLFSVYLSEQLCHHIFLTLSIHTVPLGRCALLAPLCWSFLASLWKPLEKSYFLDPLSGAPCRYPSEKTQCFATFRKKLKTHLFETHLCWSAKGCVSYCMYHSRERVCVCECEWVWVCLYVCLPACLSVNVRVCMRYLCVHLWGNL